MLKTGTNKLNSFILQMCHTTYNLWFLHNFYDTFFPLLLLGSGPERLLEAPPTESPYRRPQTGSQRPQTGSEAQERFSEAPDRL